MVEDRGAVTSDEGKDVQRRGCTRARVSDEGKNGRGRGGGVQTRDKMRRMENGERWLRHSGLASRYTVGDHMGKEGE